MRRCETPCPRKCREISLGRSRLPAWHNIPGHSPNSSHADFTAPTAVAGAATRDHRGVKTTVESVPLCWKPHLTTAVRLAGAWRRARHSMRPPLRHPGRCDRKSPPDRAICFALRESIVPGHDQRVEESWQSSRRVERPESIHEFGERSKRCRISNGTSSFRLPLRKPSRSSVTNLKPSA